MKIVMITHCPYCEKKLNNGINDDGSCPGCNADLRHVSMEFEFDREDEKSMENQRD